MIYRVRGWTWGSINLDGIAEYLLSDIEEWGDYLSNRLKYLVYSQHKVVFL